MDVLLVLCDKDGTSLHTKEGFHITSVPMPGTIEYSWTALEPCKHVYLRVTYLPEAEVHMYSMRKDVQPTDVLGLKLHVTKKVTREDDQNKR